MYVRVSFGDGRGSIRETYSLLLCLRVSGVYGRPRGNRNIQRVRGVFCYCFLFYFLAYRAVHMNAWNSRLCCEVRAAGLFADRPFKNEKPWPETN